MLTTYLQFKIKNGTLHIPVGNRQYAEIRLNEHTVHVLSDTAIKVRSFAITPTSLSLCISKEASEYKAAWGGVPVIQLSKSETRGTSKLCYQCGERLQGSRDKFHRRQLWCNKCKKRFDRDIVAAMNISRKGAEVFQRSKGLAGEAMKGNPTTPVILRVDASKLNRRGSLFFEQNPVT